MKSAIALVGLPLALEGALYLTLAVPRAGAPSVAAAPAVVQVAAPRAARI